VIKRHLSTLVFCLLFLSVAKASDIKYSIFEIPDSLKKNANSIVRVSETTFKVDDNFNSTYTVHYVLTLLNSKALDDAELKVYYDNVSTVNYLKFKIYNSFGEDITRTFKSLEVTDESATTGGTLYSDDRCKVVSPVFAQYPVTIEYSYQVKDVVIFYYPAWAPVTSTNMALQQASYTLVTPKSRTPRMKSVNKVPEVSISHEQETNQYKWEISNFAAIDTEPFSPPFYELIPYLLLAPDYVKYNTYSGAFASWSDFGKFCSFLNSGRDQLPPETVVKLQSLVKDCADNKSRIKAVYKYMQDRTRYVGVQIGIGGWQPAPADFVDRKGYGDCKGLVNYTKALLKAVDIDSYYSLVKSGNNSAPVIESFPSTQFDHVILCVPDQNDTIWLECTSQKCAFGFLGSFTDNRLALVLNDNGGKLVRTHVYNEALNTSNRRITVVMDEAGDATVKMFTTNKAVKSEAIEEQLSESPEDQRKDFLKRIGYSDCVINTLKYNLSGDIIPVGTVEAELEVPAFASKNGNRLFIPAVSRDRFIPVPQNTTPRVNPVVIRNSFTDSDTAIIYMPGGLKAEFIPGQQRIESKFGKYVFSAEMKGEQLFCYRMFEVHAGWYKASEYAEFIAFLRKIAKSDQTKIVLTQKN